MGDDKKEGSEEEQGEDLTGSISIIQQNESRGVEEGAEVAVSVGDKISNRGPTSPTPISTTSSSSPSNQPKRYQAISCIEVIEHLPSKHDAALALETILCKYKPDFAFFSTPNYESNGAIRRAATNMNPKNIPKNTLENSPKSSKGIIKGKKISSESSSSISASASNLKNENQLNVPMDMDVVEVEVPESFRESDHKFEFTRQQFRDWACEGVRVSGGEYEVSFSEVGAGLQGMTDKKGVLNEDEKVYILSDVVQENEMEDEMEKGGLVGDVCGIESGRYVDIDGSLRRSRERGCGGASQVAIFRRIKTESENRETDKNDDMNMCGDGVGKIEGEIKMEGGNIMSIPKENNVKKNPASLFWRWSSSP